MTEETLAKIFEEARRKGEEDYRARQARKAAEAERGDAPTAENPPEPDEDAVMELPIDELRLYAGHHPFRMCTPSQLKEMEESIRVHGVLMPLLVRPLDNGQYEVIDGRNRLQATKNVGGYQTIPCLVRRVSDDDVLLQIVATTLDRRSDLLPSEKAFAYKLKMEALAHQGKRTSGHGVQKWSRDDISTTENGRSVQRYIRLTHLIPELLEMVDAGRLPLVSGVELSYLSSDSQQIIYRFCFVSRKLAITKQSAAALRRMDAEGGVDEPALHQLFLSPAGLPQLKSVSVKLKRWKKYFPAEATEADVVNTVETALAEYFNKRAKNT